MADEAALEEALAALEGVFGDSGFAVRDRSAAGAAVAVAAGGGVWLACRLGADGEVADAHVEGAAPRAVLARLSADVRARLPADVMTLFAALRDRSPPEEEKEAVGEAKAGAVVEPEGEGALARSWLWFHHIRGKRKLIERAACADDRFSGFFVTGKPGLMVVEGPEGAVDALVRDMKGWSWKKMTERWREPARRRLLPAPFAERAFASMGALRALLEEHCGFARGEFGRWLGL